MLRQTLGSISENPQDLKAVFQLIRMFDLHEEKRESVSSLVKLAEIVSNYNEHLAKRILRKAILTHLELHTNLKTNESDVFESSKIIVKNYLSLKPNRQRSSDLKSILYSSEAAILSKESKKETQSSENGLGLEIQMHALEKNKKTRSKTVIGKVVLPPSQIRPKPVAAVPSEETSATLNRAKQKSNSANFADFFAMSKLPQQYRSTGQHYKDSLEGVLLFCVHLYHLSTFSEKNKKTLCIKLGKYFANFDHDIEFKRFAHINFPYFSENFLSKELNFS